MMKNNAFLLIFLACAFVVSQAYGQSTDNRWVINAAGGITWNIDTRLPHADHIEMSGEQISVVLRYGVSADSAFVLERSFVWPMLRTIPNNTHASLMRRFGWNYVEDMLLINNRRAGPSKVKSISLDGVMTVNSEFSFPRNGKVELTRTLFPSTTQAAFCEKYVLRNVGQAAVTIEAPESRSVTRTEQSKGVDGEYILEAFTDGAPGRILNEGDSLVLYAHFQAYRHTEKGARINVEQELAERRQLIDHLWSRLVVQTPDPVINTMFAFSKIRASESIYKTKGGYMHGPGGESYYAAIWANDQAEYINPFFPFTGYEKGNMSALNSYRHFARFMNDEYKPIPSSIIAEGIDIWHGAGDRGDGAMIAYGAARYALARGDRQEAEELWPLIEWCLEYCRRNINEEGVVKSKSDELEGRFPAGNANLCTSSLYYDALLSATFLGRNLQKPSTQINTYIRQAQALRKAIERHFGATVEGFQTYRYYDGNDILRSWICVPLTMGIFDRKEGTIAALFSPRLWTNDGLLTQAGTQTFWDRSTLYALRGVFAAGASEKGLDYLERYSQRRLLGNHVPYPIEAWPEGSQRHLSAESGLYCRIYTEGLFGIRPTGLRSFTICPHLPDKWDQMSIKSCHAFGQVFDIHVVRKGGKLEVTVNNAGGTVLKKSVRPGETIAVTFK